MDKNKFLKLISPRKKKDKHTEVTENELHALREIDKAWYNFGHNSLHIILITVCLLIFTFIVWASFAAIDEVVRAEGQVVPSQRVQTIQHLEGGILRDVLVKEGDIVEEGTMLARIENIGMKSQVTDIQDKILEHRIAITRIEAELKDEEPVFIPLYIQKAPAIVDAEMTIYQSNKQKLEWQTEVQEQQKRQKTLELEEFINRQSSFEDALALAQKRLDLAKPLLAKKLFPEVEYLTLQQEIVRLKGEISALDSSISKAESSVNEAEQVVKLTKAEMYNDMLKELSQRKSELATLENTLVSGSDKIQRTDVRSPIKATVNRIHINTRGGVVKPGEVIMELIPFNDYLVIEAKVRPIDRAFIFPGQSAIIKISAYDPSIFGSLKGRLTQIGADTVSEANKDSYYSVKLQTNESVIHYRDDILPIFPGMMASVDIITGKKTVLSYLLKPLIKAKSNALKER